MKKIRTRFAPSPTGYMHIGNLRTALYAYLFAVTATKTKILPTIKNLAAQCTANTGKLETLYP